jgi:DNA (cytosine-5)-methyltransferase 1
MTAAVYDSSLDQLSQKYYSSSRRSLNGREPEFSSIVKKFCFRDASGLIRAMKKMSLGKEFELTGVDLFAGAGGFTLAAKEVGVRIRAAVEINIHAGKTYRKNFITRKHNAPVLFNSDISNLSFADLMKGARLKKSECDILLGGPPCQGFSTHRINDAGVDDPRNSLLFRYFEFVEALSPKVFVVENVPGLLWTRHEKYLKKFIHLANTAGYIVRAPEVLNAKDYGVPQSRKRVFIVGVRSDVNRDLDLNWPPAATHFAPDSAEVLQLRRPAWLAAKTAFKKPLDDSDINATHMNHSEKLIEVFKKTPINGGSRSDSGRILPCHGKHDGHSDVYGRIDPDKPSPTMTTACINPSKGRFVHPTLHHGITARHAARFQTFPDSFIFEGGIIAAGVQIGNAVPVKLGKAVLQTIATSLASWRAARAQE